MNFRWEKKSLIFDPTKRFDWMDAYAQVPTVLDLGDKLRIYFTCRPARDSSSNFVSFISFIDVSRKDFSNILYVHNKPILALGGAGEFDEFGTHPGSLIRRNDLIYFYYQGWSRLVSVPYVTSLGLAISRDQGFTFEKFANGPLFGRNFVDPYLENGFFVYPQEESYYLFYASCKKWLHLDNKMEPIYKIVSATSLDGISWTRSGKELFPQKFHNEASGRPTVIKIADLYHMWFCYRDVTSFRGNVNGAYRIGYASSNDLNEWSREDSKAGIDVSESGWDSEMIAYPCVTAIDDKIYMFYNGNEFGKAGFGYAELKLY